MKMYYHTRHIPEEHLVFGNPTAVEVKQNGLCDVLDMPLSAQMKEFGMEYIETRCVWDEVEQTEGVLDFSRLKRDLKKIKEGGFGAAVFPWFQHHPAWFKDYTPLKCLEHGEESTIISLWDPKLLETYDRLYGALAAECGEDIDFVYIGVYSDYGETCFPLGVTHYYFSPPHGHVGIWSADVYARRDWARYLQGKYGSVEALSEAWEEEIHSFEEDLMVFDAADSPKKRLDFAVWYSDSITNLVDAVCRIFRKHFPNTRAGLPIGMPREPLGAGQVKSQMAKVAAKYGVTARWTGVALYGDVAHSHICARRVSSGAKFYGADFGVEATLTQNAEEAAPAIYETMTNNTKLFHQDPMNILRGRETYEQIRNMEHPGEFICNVGVVYPVESEMCMMDCDGEAKSGRGMNLDDYYNATAKLRFHTDFDMIDTYMIRDGVLDTLEKVVLLENVEITQECAELLKNWEKAGGKVYYAAAGAPRILETGERIMIGRSYDNYDIFGKKDGWIYTRHPGKITRHHPETGAIEIIYRK